MVRAGAAAGGGGAAEAGSLNSATARAQLRTMSTAQQNQHPLPVDVWRSPWSGALATSNSAH